MASNMLMWLSLELIIPLEYNVSGISCSFLTIGLDLAEWGHMQLTALSTRGGIVARGVLLDFVRYAAKAGITYDPLGPYAISLEQIKEMIAEEKLDLRQGDVLIIRSGLSKYIRASKPEDKGPFDRQTHIGVDPTPKLLEWIWDQNLAAVAGDAIAFEAVPATDGSCMPGTPIPSHEIRNANEHHSHASPRGLSARLGYADRRAS
jgi:hypothetical protein